MSGANEVDVNRLVRRFGWKRIFQAAETVQSKRRDDWFAWCCANPYDSGRPGIYKPRAEAMSRRWNHAHQVASDLYHQFISPNDG